MFGTPDVDVNFVVSSTFNPHSTSCEVQGNVQQTILAGIPPLGPLVPIVVPPSFRPLTVGHTIFSNTTIRTSELTAQWESGQFMVGDNVGGSTFGLPLLQESFLRDLSDFGLSGSSGVERIVQSVEPFFHRQFLDQSAVLSNGVGFIDPGSTDLLVTDANGRRTGVLSNGTQVREIPNSFYLDVDDKPLVYIASPTDGTFEASVTGRSQGEYELVVVLVEDYEVIAQNPFSGPIADGIVVTYSSTLDSEQLNSTVASIEALPGTGPGSFFEPQLGTFLVVGSEHTDNISIRRNPENDEQLVASINGELVRTPNATPLLSDVRVLTVKARDGNDHVNLVGLREFDGSVIARGGLGDDHIIGSRGDDVLLGGPGYDIIFGGPGNDIIIGGLDTDLLLGSFGRDLIIGGNTAFDDNDSALLAIKAEWTNSEHSYVDRVANIRGDETSASFGSRLNGEFFLKSGGEDATVFDDEYVDLLFGGFGRDWFFGDLLDWHFDRRRRERLN